MALGKKALKGIVGKRKKRYLSHSNFVIGNAFKFDIIKGRKDQLSITHYIKVIQVFKTLRKKPRVFTHKWNISHWEFIL